MLSTALNIVLGVFRFDVKRSVRSMTITVALVVAAVVALLIGAGFGLSLLYFWLESTEGTVLALTIIAAGCAVLGLVLLLFAFARPKRRDPRKAFAPHYKPHEPGMAGSERMFDEAIAAMQKGSRESMLAAVAFALVAGMMAGRKL
jgi:hypothetical protein